MMGAGLLGFACSRILLLSLLCLGVVGLGGVLTMASSNTLVQSFVDEDKRGRVMSIFTMAFTGTMPIGNLLAGWAAGAIGPSVTLAITGLLALAVAFRFYLQLPGLRAEAAPLLARVIPPEGEGFPQVSPASPE